MQIRRWLAAAAAVGGLALAPAVAAAQEETTWGQIGGAVGGKSFDIPPPPGQFVNVLQMTVDRESGDVYLLDLDRVEQIDETTFVVEAALRKFGASGGSLSYDRSTPASDRIVMPDTHGFGGFPTGRAMGFDSERGWIYVYLSAADYDSGLSGTVFAFDAETLERVDAPTEGIIDGVVPLDLDGGPGTADDLVGAGSLVMSPDAATMYVSGSTSDAGVTRRRVYAYSTDTWQRTREIGVGRSASEPEQPGSVGGSTHPHLLGVNPQDGSVYVHLRNGSTDAIKRFTPDGSVVPDGTIMDDAGPTVGARGHGYREWMLDVLPSGALVGPASYQEGDSVAVTSAEPLAPLPEGAGSVRLWFGGQGSGTCQFDTALAAAALDDGTVYVYDNEHGTIRRFGYGGSGCAGAGLENEPPAGSITVSNPQPFVGEAVTFTVDVNDPNPGDDHTFEWDLDGDPTTGQDGFETTGESPTRSYATPGELTVRARVTDGGGLQAVLTAPMEVLPPEEEPDPPAPPPPGPPGPPQPGPPSDPQPSPDTTAPVVRASGSSASADRRGRLALKLPCPAGETQCAGTVRLQVKEKRGRRTKTVTIASARFSAAGGQTATARPRLSAKGRKLLARAKRGRLKVTVKVTAADAAGNDATTTRTLTIKRPKAGKRR